jgi:hypothetical protein
LRALDWVRGRAGEWRPDPGVIGCGGGSTYGYRYAMDFVPFLFALVAIAVRDRFGNLERTLIALSICFVCYGYFWQVWK